MPRLVFRADDVDHFIEIEIGDAQTIEQVEALFDLVETILEAASHGVGAEAQPLAQDHLQRLQLWSTVERSEEHTSELQSH